MKLSARNNLKGKVRKIITGAVNSEVVVDLGSGLEIVSIVTRESVEGLGLKEGGEVFAVIKASNVMLGVEH
jgi:molybdopterin-binding protein